jgi:hypothetical protein
VTRADTAAEIAAVVMTAVFTMLNRSNRALLLEDLIHKGRSVSYILR